MATTIESVILEQTAKGIERMAHTVWQDAGEDMPEAAVMIKEYNGPALTITQEGRELNINYKSLREFAKLFNQIAKRHEV
jgi:hypothetical protein